MPVYTAVPWTVTCTTASATTMTGTILWDGAVSWRLTTAATAYAAPAWGPDPAEAAAARRAVAEAERQATREARARAEALLAAHLTAAQAAAWAAENAFTVETPAGRRYRLRRGWAGNVDELDERGAVVATLCVHPREDVPDADNVLAQLLHLRFNEDALRRVANRTPVRLERAAA